MTSLSGAAALLTSVFRQSIRARPRASVQLLPHGGPSPPAGHMTRVHQAGFSGTDLVLLLKTIKRHKRDQREGDVIALSCPARGRHRDRAFVLVVQTGSGAVMLLSCTSGHRQPALLLLWLR